MNILLVDDDSSRLIMAMFLREGGYQVTVCSNGYDALEQYAARDFDLLITDINMPDISGIELLRKIRRMPGKPIINVIVCSAISGPESLKALGKYGVYKILMKPISVEELMSVIHNLEERMKLTKGNGATG